jgi:predicted nucleotidyltransferase
MGEHFELPQAEIEAFCRQWKIQKLELFGSAVRGELTPESDIDLLATWQPDADWSLLDHVRMERELSGILARKVDLVSRRAVEGSRNWILRQHILSSARTVYAA